MLFFKIRSFTRKRLEECQFVTVASVLSDILPYEKTFLFSLRPEKCSHKVRFRFRQVSPQLKILTFTASDFHRSSFAFCD
jgi:hypothetical protein